MEFSEKELEDFLFENPRELGVSEWIGRQVKVPSGIIDLLGKDRNLGVVVVELKVEFDKSALLQVCRYAADIERAMKLRCTAGDEDIFVFKAVVASGKIDNQLFFEAQALGVQLYQVRPHFRIGSQVDWTDEYKADLRNQYGLIDLELGESLEAGIVRNSPKGE